MKKPSKMTFSIFWIANLRACSNHTTPRAMPGGFDMVTNLIKCRQRGVIMQINGKLDQKKNDYVKYAFILKEKGELSTNELQYWVKNTFPFVDCSKNRISAIVCRKSIFITRQIGQKQKAHSYSGDIPISKRVKTQWLEKLSLKG